MFARCFTKLIISFLAISFILSFSPLVHAQNVETRHLRSDQQTVNGLTAYKLGLTESALLKELYIEYSSKVYVGIRVWVRHADGTETEVLGGSGVATAVVSFLAGASLTTTLSAGFGVVNDVPLSPTDAIVVRVYGDVASPPSALLAEFVTEQLGGSVLNAASWTVYYRLRRTASVRGLSYFYFRFGIADDDSYITNFKWTPTTAKQWHDVALWDFQVLTRNWYGIASIGFTLQTRAWQNVTTWIIQTISRGWNNVVSWTFNLFTLGWRNIVIWIWQTTTTGWHNVVNWSFQTIISIASLPFPLILAVIIIIIGVVLLMKNKFF